MDARRTDPGRRSLAQPALLYDGACAFCRAQVRLGAPLLRHALALRPLAEAAAELPPAELARARAALTLVEGDGAVTYGAAAISRALELAGWPLSARLYRIPALRRLADRGYAWVARNRYRLSGARPACGDGACGLPGDRRPPLR